MARRTALHGRPDDPRQSSAARPTYHRPGDFIPGIQEEEEDEHKDDWFTQTEEHQTLGGPYRNVHIYLTDKGFSTVQKWCHTQMIGVLRIKQVRDCDSHPLIVLELKGTDPAGIERDVVFEYELPFNFRFDHANLTRTFSALSLKIRKDDHIGFFFESVEDREDFDGKMHAIQNQLRVDKPNFEAFKAQVLAKQQEEQEEELAGQIDCYNILSGQDQDKRAQDLRKILILAGLRVETDLNDPATVQLIQTVLQNFNPDEQMDEDEAMFSARFNDFELQHRRQS